MSSRFAYLCDEFLELLRERERELERVKLGSKRSTTYFHIFELPINSMVGSRFLLCCLSGNKHQHRWPRHRTDLNCSGYKRNQHCQWYDRHLAQYQEYRCRIPVDAGALWHRQNCDFNPTYSCGDDACQIPRHQSESIEYLPANFNYYASLRE